MNLLHFRFISIILSSNDGDLNRFDGDRISICTINILISSIYYIVLRIVFSLKLHYFFTIFHYFIVFASELSNARISGFANTFAKSSGSTSSATVALLFSCCTCICGSRFFSHKMLLQKALHFSFGHHPEYESTHP